MFTATSEEEEDWDAELEANAYPQTHGTLCHLLLAVDMVPVAWGSQLFQTEPPSRDS